MAYQPKPAEKNPRKQEAAPPSQDWNALFASQKPTAEAVRELVSDLVESGQHAEIVALIETAIRNGVSAPWMYEVLALSMELSGRSKADVERALLSSSDLSVQDARSLLFLGSYLARVGRAERALGLYKYASELEPGRSDGYIMAMQLCDRSRSYDDLLWAAPGVYATAWSRDRQSVIRQTEAAIAGAEAAFKKAGESEKWSKLATAVAESQVYDLVIKAEWSGVGDIDLLVDEPTGETCSSENRQTAGGGIHPYDGFGPAAANCHELYVCPTAHNGTYTVRVRHVWGNIVGKRVTLTIVEGQGTPEARTTRQSVEIGRDDARLEIEVKQGRRVAGVWVPVPIVNGSSPALDQPAAPGEFVSKLPKQGTIHRQPPAGGRPGQAAPVGTVIQGVTSGERVNAGVVVSPDRRSVRISISAESSELKSIEQFSPVTP